MVKTPKKNIIDQKPNTPIPPKDIAQGKRKAISKSNIMNILQRDNILYQISF